MPRKTTREIGRGRESMTVYREYDLDALEVQYDVEATVDSLEAIWEMSVKYTVAK